MSRLRPLTAALLLLAATSAFASGSAVSLIPADAVSVGVVRVADLRTSPLSSTLFEHADRFGGNGEAEDFLTDAGLDLTKDIDVLVVATAPTTRLGSEAEVVVLADGRFAVARLTAALVERGAVKKTSAYGDYYGLPDSDEKQGAVAFPSGSLAIAGTEGAVLNALQAYRSGDAGFAQSLLGHQLGRIDSGASAWALVDVTRAIRLTGGADRLNHTRDDKGAALAAAVRNISTVALWAKDTGNALQLGAVGLGNDDETLQLVEDTIRGALSAMRLTVKDKSPELVSVLRKFDVKRSNGAVSVNGTIPGESIRKLMAEKRARK